ncbi:MAG: type 4a pilus biogenesis protein PilO [Candidatus Binatia bacterium]
MDWKELTHHRLPIAIALAVILLVGWYAYGYRPRSDEIADLDAREQTLAAENDRVVRQISEQQASRKQPRMLPSRVAPALARDLAPVDRLNYFLDNITGPANALELSYFAVTPLAPVAAPSYEEIPFSISVSGSYAALADYLYQLEYGQDFIVRDMNVALHESAIQANFRLSALVLRDAAELPPRPAEKDPGRPTSLELARDPFTRPPAKVAVGADGKGYFLNVPPGLQLSGTMQSGGRIVAIINHEPYGVGQTIANKTITKISDRGVELSDKVRSYFLEMEQPPYSMNGKTKEVSAR